jgi:pimeloyl-ACP methyl ester carboxylesterase
MKKLRIIKFKVLLIAFLISLCASELFGQNTTINPTKINFSHNGNQLHGWFYKAQGNGPFSTVILLHGSVGQDGDIFNLGKILSKEGFNVMTYNYPGSWRSEGNRTDDSALGSVQSAINFVKSDYSIQSFETDTSDIILIGYSYGAGMALLASTFDSSVKKVITIALGDLSLTAEQLEKNPNARNSFEQMVDGILSNPIVGRGNTGKKYVEELIKNKDKYDIKRYAEELAKKKLLFLVGWLDNDKRIENDVLPLYRELQSKGAKNVEISAFETNHRFLNVQKEFTETIINWLKE